MAQRGVLAFDALIGADAEFVKHANQLRLHCGATRLARDEAHLADRRVWPQTSHADRVAACIDHDADSPVQEEMHGVGRLSLAYDNLSRLNLNPLTVMDQPVSILGAAECFSKPLAQGGVLALRLVRLDDRVLTRFEGTVEIGRHHDVLGNKSSTQHVFCIARKARQYDLCAALLGELLNLYEVEDRRRIDSSDQPKIKQ